MQKQNRHFCHDKGNYNNRVFAKLNPANDNEFHVKKKRPVEQLDAEYLTEFEWARRTSKTWDMGQD